MELGWDSACSDPSQTLCTRVFRAYKLGLVDLETEDLSLAQENLNFAAEHGNQLAAAAWAKEAIR